MTLAPSVARLLEEIASQVRRRRAESGALRGAFWGAFAAALLLLAKGGIEDVALPIALGVWSVCIGAGALLGAARRPSQLEVARIADQSFEMQDRIATSLEYCGLDRTEPLDRLEPFTAALIADTEARVSALPARRIIPLHVPREARYLVLPVLAVLALAILPPIPGADNWLPEALTGKTPRDPYASATRDERARLFGWDLKQKDAFAKQDAMLRATAEKQAGAEDNSAFKDKSTNKPKSDFASFVQKGDDRLKLLERTDRLPDLQSDFASSKYRMMMQKTQELSAGKGGQISQRRLEQVLREMQRMGKKGGDWSDDVSDGLQALEEGHTEEAMNSMQTALSKLRAQEDRERNSRRIAGSREKNQDNADESRGGSRGSQANDMDRMGYASGAQKSTPSSGKASARLRSTPYDAGVEGQRRGRMPAVETGQTTRPQSTAMQLQLMGDMIQYRRAMEDAITREQVPRDYHDQIRDYFKSLQQ
ncbi:MAG: hypothetical protein EXR28_05760 [Betaproteobacteria bacterium]|nr:hypothetical protein [Betaproteobacteria bacterium]